MKYVRTFPTLFQLLWNHVFSTLLLKRHIHFGTRHVSSLPIKLHSTYFSLSHFFLKILCLSNLSLFFSFWNILAISISKKQRSSRNETSSCNKTDTLPSTPIQSPLKPEEWYTSTKIPSSPIPSSPTNHDPSLQPLSQDHSPDSSTRAPGSASEGWNPVNLVTASTEKQPSSSQLGPTSSSISERFFNGDLPIEKMTRSNILASCEEWVVKGLTKIKGDDLFAQEEAKSPDL